MPYTGEILELGDLIPERRPVAIVRRGERVVLMGYADGPSCPGSVLAAQQGARNRWLKLRDEAASDYDPNAAALAWVDFVRVTLMAVVPGLEFDEADIIAGNADRYEAVLTHLGWWRAGTDEQDPEVPGETPSTGDEFSPTLTPSTDAVTG